MKKLFDPFIRPELPEKGHPFITGSQAYGTPTAESDLDVVIKITPSIEKFIRIHADVEDDVPIRDVSDYERTSFRFGSLNIIGVTTEEEYDVWYEGTRRLMLKSPVTREDGIAMFAKLRQQGVDCPE